MGARRVHSNVWFAQDPSICSASSLQQRLILSLFHRANPYVQNDNDEVLRGESVHNLSLLLAEGPIHSNDLNINVQNMHSSRLARVLASAYSHSHVQIAATCISFLI